ncbi:hypothetical protein Bca52824_030307 [Brassica carinata]|uniref:Uncharacterized protein n=1 Tax=Brassica carinata TaxID=52824 RepID=A0A8X7V6L2_BRACI|nr:hypothetical protein Bca52824_030307 [Brassica carinata]
MDTVACREILMDQNPCKSSPLEVGEQWSQKQNEKSKCALIGSRWYCKVARRPGEDRGSTFKD